MNPVTSRQILSLLDGDATSAEKAQLADLVERDNEAGREFDEAIRFESLLLAAHQREADEKRVGDAIRVRMLMRRMRILRGWLSAAATLVALASGVLVLLSLGRGGGTVEEGRVLVGDAPVQRVREGDILHTGADTGGVVRLADGSRMAMAPDCAAVIRGRSGGIRQVVELRKGTGDFEVEKGVRQFAVITKVGRVTVLGTKFSVQLLPEWQRKEEDQMNGKAVLAMAVAVTMGSVQVEVGGRIHNLSAGAQQVFAEESGGQPKTPAKPRVSESERAGESAQPAKPRKSGEGEGRSASSEKSISGEISEILGNTVTLKQGGDKGTKTMAITLDGATVVSIETDEMESVQGEGGQSKQRRKVAVGALGDLAVGKKVTVTEANGVVTKVLVRATPAKRSGGEGEKNKTEASAGQIRRGGEGDRTRESGGGQQGEKKGGKESER